MRRRPEISAGLLAFRRGQELEVLLAHPGGPFWAKKDDGAWTIPKGVVEAGPTFSPQPSENLPKKRIYARSALSLSWHRPNRRAESWCTPGRSKRISISDRSRATCSRWSGRPAQ